MGDFEYPKDKQSIHNETAQIIGVKNLQEAREESKKLLQKGIDCIELCGAFGEEGKSGDKSHRKPYSRWICNPPAHAGRSLQKDFFLNQTYMKSKRHRSLICGALVFMRLFKYILSLLNRYNLCFKGFKLHSIHINLKIVVVDYHFNFSAVVASYSYFYIFR